MTHRRLPVPMVLRGLARVLVDDGVAARDAVVTARILVEGSARGYPDHGVDRIFQIRDGFRQGSLRPGATWRTVRSTSATAVIDAGHGLGQPVGRAAMRRAVALARSAGIGCVGVRNAGHLGVLAYYAEIAARQDCVGMVLSTTSPAAVVPGGARTVLGTNPIACAVPSSAGPVVLDVATTAVTRGRVFSSRGAGTLLPEGVAVDAAGAPTRDPAAALAGGLLPLGGGMKGALLGLLVATVAGPLIGTAPNVDVVGTRFMQDSPNKGDLFLAFAIDAFTEAATFGAGIDRQVSMMAESSDRFHPPGSRSRRRTEAAMREGLRVSDRLAVLLGQVAGWPTISR